MRIDLELVEKLHTTDPFALVDIQWFAAEDEGRTEEPTEHKLRKAREEGKVVKSQEFTSAIILIFGIAVIALLASYLLENIMAMIRFYLNSSNEIDITSDTVAMNAFMGFFLKIMLPILLVVFIAAFLANVVQVGFLFTAKTITPDLSKLVPRFGKFFKRALFSAEAAFNFGKSVFKVVVVGIIVVLNVQLELPRIINLLRTPFYKGFELISTVVFRIVLETAVLMLVLSLFDYMFQRRLHRESLKMSKQEIKEERKMYEGDPLVKSRLRERMRQIMTTNMLKAVPKADVVITNPVHYAIALEWERISMIAPMVIAKGAGPVAHKIKEIAAENQVPVVENKPLAQALYKEVEIGDVIPEKFYEVIATILAEIYKLKEKVQEVI